MLVTRRATGQIELPAPNPALPITVDAEQAEHWRQGAHDVWILHGRAVVAQGDLRAAGDEAVVWIKHDEEAQDPKNRVIVYLDGNVLVGSGPSAEKPGERPANSITDATWLGEFRSAQDVTVRVANAAPEPKVKPAIYRQALAAQRDRRCAGEIAQSSQPGGFGLSSTGGGSTGSAASPRVQLAQLPAPPPEAVAPVPVATRRIQVYSRSRVPHDYELTTDPARNETIIRLRRGVNVIVDGLPGYGAIDISADNVVIWTTGAASAGGETLQGQDVPLEIYMEGNVVFRQGDREIFAQRMYYDVRQQIGTVLGAEVYSPIPKFAPGLKMRLKAAVAQQTGPGRFVMQDAYVTSSRMALPGYRLQANNVIFEDKEVPVTDPATGTPQVDPATGQPVVAHDRLVTSRNNFIFIENVPVFYWPVIKNDVEQTNFYLRQVRYKSDHIFGQQLLLDWDVYQLLGMKRPAGTDWTFSTDYFSARGPALGTAYRWHGSDFFGLNGPYNGFIDAWGIHDHGLDTLGSDRMNLLPEPDITNRYKVLGRHRQYLSNNFQFTGEVGLISDRNFLEQYFEREWDQSKDYDTELMLKQYRGNSTWDVMGSVRVNDWFTQTQWLPRADHFWIGQELVADRLTWYEHSSLGYANMRIAARPTDPSEEAKFAWLPWEANVQGGRYFTTQEIDFPFTVGVANFVPYALGQLAHWDQTLEGPETFRVPGGPMDRAYGQFGVRRKCRSGPWTRRSKARSLT